MLFAAARRTEYQGTPWCFRTAKRLCSRYIPPPVIMTNHLREICR